MSVKNIFKSDSYYFSLLKMAIYDVLKLIHKFHTIKYGNFVSKIKY